MTGRILTSIAFAAMAACAFGQDPTTAVPVSRDMILSLAIEHTYLHWYCDTFNIYTGITNATCPYTTVGYKDGIPYKWGGYDSRDSYWKNVVVNHGYAGDTNSAAIVSGTYGDDCSGFASRTLRSGRYTTSGFPGVCTTSDYAHIAPGDLMNNASSHVRIFEKFTATGTIQEFECTTGVSPGRCVRRIISRDDAYTPLKYNKTVTWPSIVSAISNGSNSVTIGFLGKADTGFRVYQSTDATNWTLVVSESTLGVLTQSATVSGLSQNTTYYFVVRAVNTAGESDSSCVFPVRIAPTARKALIVNGYDRWIGKTESAGKPPTFLTRYADALTAAGYSFDTVDNMRVADPLSGITLTNYSSVWWMTGDESTSDETLNNQEELALQTYLKAGGKLFLSGSEILWDLGTTAKQNPINDAAFVSGYLYATYSADGTSGNGYTFTGVAGTAFAGLSGAFDNGTGGTFNVVTPDVITPAGDAQSVLKYGTGTVAATLRKGTFGGGTAQGSVFLCGFPFETITTQAARRSVVTSATTAFFPASGVTDWSVY